MKKLLPLVFLSLILIMPFAAAQFYYGYLNPSDLLDNPWFIFTAFFAVFFGVIYASVGRVIGGTAPALVISAAIAFVISAGMQRNWYVLEQPIMFWAVVLVVLLIALIFIKVLVGGGGVSPWIVGGFILTLWGLWPFLKNLMPIDTIGSIPYSVTEVLDRTWFIALIAAVVTFIIRSKIKVQGYMAALKAGRRPYKQE